jgi:hypothetical protein
MFSSAPNEHSLDRPLPTSYDTGYEHSVEHWFDLKKHVEEANEERPRVMAQRAGA